MTSDYYFGKWFSNPPPGEEVVITGISGRFPESKNVSEFRDNLFKKIDMVTEDTRRWDLADSCIPSRCGKIDDLQKFDAGYFGVHHRQAHIMDPMTRKALETAIEAIMDAGLNPRELKGTKTGVFCAVGYAELEVQSLINIRQHSFGKIAYLKSMLPDRISFFLKVKGPSYLIDSACSSSLNAVEAATFAIRRGRCDNAIIVGANLVLNPQFTRQVYQLGALSPEGKCKSFDQEANGYVRSDAVVCAFLQKANKARRVYAKIIHIKVNNDGFKKDGITVPSAQNQQQLITEVLQESGTDPSRIGYVEAHGTGTKVGDPQEAQALDEAIAQKRQKPLLIGSVKSCIGHPEPSSGLCSLIKAVIALDTGLIAPNLHFKQVREGLKGIEEGRMEVVTELKKLEGDLVAINNLGFGGSNCHLVLQRFEKTKTDYGDGLPRLVCVSGRTQQALWVMLEQITRTHDEEWVGLLHQIFKWDVSGHPYRGFTIVAKNGPVETSLKFYNQQQTQLFVFFGNFRKSVESVKKHLLAFTSFRSTIERINNCLLSQRVDPLEVFYNNREMVSVLDAFAVQIGIVDLLKLLELEAVVCGGLHEVIGGYYKEELTLEEAVLAAYKLVTSEQATKEDCFENRFPQHSVILNVADEPLRNNSEDLVLKNNFLEVLGRLYEQGHNPQIHKLYPDVQYPVSRNTPMIAPLVQWNYAQNWYPYKFSKNQISASQKLYTMSLSNEDLKYLTGYVLDGINYIPPTELLSLVWKTFASSQAVVFENCTFPKSVELKSGTVLLVGIQSVSGNFEVSETGTVLATGRIFQPDLEKYQTGLSPRILKIEDKTQVLSQEEIYRELNLRGYNYRGSFKGLAHCNVEGTSGYIQWDNNWTTFIDAMLQMAVLQIDSNSLEVVTGIRRLTIDPVSHQDFIKNEKNVKFPACVYKECNMVQSGGVEICGITRRSVAKKKLDRVPVLEKYVFVPNVVALELVQSVRVNTQIIIENSMEKTLKAVEIVDDYANSNSRLILPIVGNILESTPLVVPDLTFDLDTTSGSQFLLIVTTKLFQRTTLEPILQALSPKGFILTREEVDFVPKKLNHLTVVAEHVTAIEKLILLQKSEPLKLTVFVQISWKKLDWLVELQQALKKGKSVVVHSDNQEPEGVLGLVNCIRREPNGDKVRCFFMMDEAPRFDPELPFFQKQLEKQSAVNIYQNGQWGTYRHLPLEQIQKVERECCFLENKAFNCCSEKSYVIIGGLGGFGLELAEWLISRGATKLVLASRVGVQTGYQTRKIRLWRSKGTTVEITMDNVATKEGCLELLKKSNALGPVDAVFNLAVILRDSLFEYQTQENFTVCLEPKAQAASCLDVATREECPQLRYFVMFSSQSCGLGNAGQSNYGMGLSVMERICEKRKKDGLPGLAIQWGAIGDVGVLARLQKDEELVIRGTLQQKISSCLEVLDTLLEQENPVVSSMVVAEKNTENYTSDSVVEAIAYILGIKNVKSVSPETTLSDLGLDSMTSVEAVQILRKYEILVTTEEVKSLTFFKLKKLERGIEEKSSRK